MPLAASKACGLAGKGGARYVMAMTETAGRPFDPIAALAFAFGAVVIAASLCSLLLTLFALAGMLL
jgi:hypothetical protein